MRRLTTTEFIAKSKLKHGDKFGYDQSVYYTNSTPIKITCKVHGVFMQTPAAHMIGKGCNQCAKDNVGNLVHLSAAKRREGIELYSDSEITEIALTKGYKAIVDTEILYLFEGYNWSFLNVGYAVTTLNNRKSLLMHALISKHFYGGALLDHKNRNKLDNRRCNLREVTIKQNTCNTRGALGKSSIYKGVFWYTKAQKWRAQISPNGVKIHLGTFTDEKLAAKAYNEKAFELFGEYAYLNTI